MADRSFGESPEVSVLCARESVACCVAMDGGNCLVQTLLKGEGLVRNVQRSEGLDVGQGTVFVQTLLKGEEFFRSVQRSAQTGQGVVWKSAKSFPGSPGLPSANAVRTLSFIKVRDTANDV